MTREIKFEKNGVEFIAFGEKEDFVSSEPEVWVLGTEGEELYKLDNWQHFFEWEWFEEVCQDFSETNGW